MLVRVDFNTHLYPELIDVISREDETILTEAIEAAEGEAKGYLTRYDIDALFGAVGDDRDKTLMMFLKDMTVWHYIVLANPDTDVELRKTRYDDAKKYLKDVQANRVAPFGWPVPDPTVEGSQNILVDSQPKRKTRY